jgi:hypothetical protein
MMNNSPNMKEDRIKEIWQCQPLEGIQMSADQIRRRAGTFQKKILWRNVREYAAGLIAAVLFGFFFVTSHDTLFRVGCALLIAGLAYVAWHLHRKGSARSVPAAVGAASSLQFYRGELERQRDLVASVWWWYLGPLIPGLILFAVSAALADPHPHKLGVLALVYGLCAGLFIFVWKLNARAAHCLQRLIDELYTAESQR